MNIIISDTLAVKQSISGSSTTDRVSQASQVGTGAGLGLAGALALSFPGQHPIGGGTGSGECTIFYPERPCLEHPSLEHSYLEHPYPERPCLVILSGSEESRSSSCEILHAAQNDI